MGPLPIALYFSVDDIYHYVCICGCLKKEEETVAGSRGS